MERRRSFVEVKHNAFLSCSIDEKDSAVVDFFRKMIFSLGIKPLVYDYSEIGGLSDKIKEKIENNRYMIY